MERETKGEAMNKWGKVLVAVLVCAVAALAFVAINENLEKKNVETELELSGSYVEQKDGMISELTGKLEELEQTCGEKDGVITDLTGKAEALDLANGKIDNLTQEIEELKSKIEALENKEPAQPSFEYQTLYPDMYVEPAEKFISPEGKTAYLTFDDGPSNRTDEVLAVLEKYGIKATFFVVPTGSASNNARLKAIVDAGHTIGIHTATHVYDDIYASADAFLKDFNKAYQRVVDATGVRPEIFRFPGGSINRYNRGIYQQIVAEMLRRGFLYYDWNASGDDSAGQTTAQGIADMAISTTGSRKNAIILLHDNELKYATVEALPIIIERLQAKGYNFAPLTKYVAPVTYTYKDENIK